MNIKIEGATENNLKDVNVEFGEGLTVVTGVSGSGKSSLVFDTLYHEARRRFLEYFSYGSKGLRLTPAKVRTITGLRPTVAVGQNLLNRNPNSTLATASGLHPIFRIFYSRFGERKCPNCGVNINFLSYDEIIDYLLSTAKESSILMFAQIVHNVLGSHQTLLNLLESQFEFNKIIVDNIEWAGKKLNPKIPHNILIELGKLDSKSTLNQIRETINEVKSLGANVVHLKSESEYKKIALTKSCHECGIWLIDVEPKYFHMSCPYCKGKGCTQCNNTKLHPMASTVLISKKTLPELLSLSVEESFQIFTTIKMPDTAKRVLNEIIKRLAALKAVGLGYLNLNRTSPSLSRGESQRVRIAVNLISEVEDILHVLDEPTIGQHFYDTKNFLPILNKLKGPVIYVEHDRFASSIANHVVDIGPKAGIDGGKIIFTGTPLELWNSTTNTGEYFSLRNKVILPKIRPEPTTFIKIHGAHQHNLKNVDVHIPLHRLSVITGVSGSGKSTLVEDVLFASLTKKKPIGCKELKSPSLKAIMVDQSPIGKNPRSNPVTYTKISDLLRKLFAKATNLSESHFSFNRPEGACPTCNGMGAIEIKMRYLPSTWIPCQSCEEDRFNEDVLSATISIDNKEYSIADFYRQSISEVKLLINKEQWLSTNDHQKLINMLNILEEIGLGYLPLGQSSPSLSGGEAQRIKLAKYLGKSSLKDQLIILDEPSTGLHPQDLNGLLKILDRIVRAGATIIIVEHNLDIIKAADWIIDLGLGAGKDGGEVIFAGKFNDFIKNKDSLTANALQLESEISPKSEGEIKKDLRHESIIIKNAHVHNLRNINVEFPKNSFTVVTGVSGSGKSSLVIDIIESEANRRYLETLSMYERQSTQEGPEVLVDEISGLSVTSTIFPEHKMHARFFNVRNTIGNFTEISLHLNNVLAFLGENSCPECGTSMLRNTIWICKKCNKQLPIATPNLFNPSNYRAACKACNGVGTIQIPKPEKLIIHPEKPLCKGAMYSPGFFPKGFLCKPFNGGYYMLQALSKKYNFDPFETPWNEMSIEARHAFLYGDKEPVEIYYENKKGQSYVKKSRIWGIYSDFIRDWDLGGTYSETQKCKSCNGAKLKPEYLSIKLNGYNIQQLSELSLITLLEVLENVNTMDLRNKSVLNSISIIITRLKFLIKTGLGYINLNRATDSLSAGEAQRVRLAGLLGSELTSLTVLLDEPSRGLHPTELQALLNSIIELRNKGNTVIMVEHDPMLIKAADHLIDLGPGAGINGGQIIAEGKPEDFEKYNTITANWLSGKKRFKILRKRREPTKWLTITGAKGNNLKGDIVKIPHGLLVGVCGVSGSGKSTLIIDTIGRVLAPKKHTTSVAYEPINPEKYEKVIGKLAHTIIIDQSKVHISNPMRYLGLDKPLLKIFVESEDAHSLELTEKDLKKKCTACRGYGIIKTDMGFLPDIINTCEICNGTGYSKEAWQVKVKGVSLPEINFFTIDEVYNLFEKESELIKKLEIIREVGLGYLMINQPVFSLSGGEAQRMKIAKELSRNTLTKTLYILDEPTVGQHLEDISHLIQVLQKFVEKGHTVIIIEHHPYLLASCDWLIELGPGGGPEGGYIIAEGTPEQIASGNTPTAVYIKQALEESM
jgi:excinuclease ABC subunit A